MFLIKNNDKWNFLDTKDISKRSMFLDSKKKKISVWNRKSLRNWETETSRVDGRRIKIRSILIEIAPSFRLYIYIETILLKIIRNDRSKLHSKVSLKRKRITLNLSFHFFESLSYSIYFDLLFFLFWIRTTRDC